MDRRSLRIFLRSGIVLVALVCAAAVQGSLPNVTGTWHAKGDPTPWHLTASGDQLDATWRGSAAAGHGHLRGTFTGTLDSSGSSYSGSMHITEDSNRVTAAATFTVNSATKVTVVYNQSNGVQGTIVLLRAAQKTIHWSYRGYANDVKVVKPLVGDFQLGTSNSNGSGSNASGTAGTTFQPKDSAKYGGPYSFSASVTGFSYHASAHGVTKRLVLDVTITSTNGPKCEAGDTGTLTLIDSKNTLSNGQKADKAEFAWDHGRCPGFVQGWDNTDGGAKTSPSKGGPPHGGNWAIVSIG